MHGKRLKVLTILAVVVLSTLSLWFMQSVRNRRKAAEREARYQVVLDQYASNLKPGMNREQVERYLQTNGKRFRQMCCVADFRGVHASLVTGGWDDLIKIAGETTPWFCSENNVYIALEFNPKSQSELPDTNGSDILKRVAIFHQLEGCM
jgi:hypothetical protein